MTYQQLYIDGVLMDLDENTNIVLDIKSNLFRDVTKIAANNTYTINLPKTVHNMTAIDWAAKPKAGTKYPYVFHKARFFRNGLEIIKDGRLTLLSVSDTIEVVIYWGIFPAFDKLQENNLKLNEMKADEARLPFYRSNTIDSFSDAMARGYFYADYDSYQYQEEDTYWQGKQETVSSSSSVETARSTDGETSASSGNSTSGGGSFSDKHLGSRILLPTVSVSWVLGVIKSSSGVKFSWDEECTEYIDTLAIPLVTQNADEKTLEGVLDISFVGMKAKLGKMSFSINSIISAFGETEGEEADQLIVKAGCTINLNVSANWKWDASLAKPQGSRTFTLEDGTIKVVSVYSYPTTKIVVIVTSEHKEGDDEDSYIKKYTVGSDTQYTSSNDTEMQGGYFVHEINGGGKLELQEGDIITFELVNANNVVLRNMSLYGATASADLGDSDKVPYGGTFPIALNLPDVQVVDFVKVLSLLTGTFPRQVQNNEQITFVKYSAIIDNKKNAIDWSKRLIPSSGSNLPRKIEYTTDGGFCRHNYYKWTEDDTVKGSYNADFQLDNETLDLEQNVWTLPFAASDGDKVPIQTPYSGNGSFDPKQEASSSGGDYKGCKDRITNILDGNGKARLQFNIDLQASIDDGYETIKKSLEKPKVITEYLYLSETEILHFDETVPVYLAQYGAYFAVTELKTTSNGYTEATLLQLEF